jgi:hypothetical protein
MKNIQKVILAPAETLDKAKELRSDGYYEEALKILEKHKVEFGFYVDENGQQKFRINSEVAGKTSRTRSSSLQ